MNQEIKMKNTLGMFDLIKGVGMLFIIFVHNRSLFPDIINGPKLIFLILGCFINSLIPVLLIIAGYGFRKRSIAGSFKQNARELLKPYLYAGIATIVIHFIMHYIFFRYFPGAAIETAKVFGGIFLGCAQTVAIANTTLFANGPIWYLLAMFWAVTIFNVVKVKIDEKLVPYITIALSVVGWLLGYCNYVPFCLSQGLIGVLYVYIGYTLKKNKSLLSGTSIKVRLLFLVAVIIPNLILIPFGMMDMAYSDYPFGPITYIESGLMGIVLLYFFIRMNNKGGVITRGLRTIGRYSLFVICLHSIEMVAVPWYLLAEKFSSNEITGFWTIYGLRILLIFVGCCIVLRFNHTMRKRQMDRCVKER